MNTRCALRKHHAFSLVELLVVVGIVSVLAAMLLPILEQSVDAARTARCASQLKQIGAGSHLYSQDYSGALPQFMPNHWKTLLPPYLGSLFAANISAYGATKMPGDENIAYCPAYDRNMGTWSRPDIARNEYWNVNTYQPNYILDLRRNGAGTITYHRGIRLHEIPYPSDCVLFAESSSHEPVNRWLGGLNGVPGLGGYAVYYNPRHGLAVPHVRADGSVARQPFVLPYATQNLNLNNVLGAADLFSWRSWGYGVPYPGQGPAQ